MCGIASFVGENAALSCYDALKKLEYRGYDSVGMATSGEKIVVCKKKGYVKNIEPFAKNLDCKIAIAHTRWATHGQACELNAHPHVSYDGEVAVVHNGIIENYQALKSELESQKIDILSQTDTEVALDFIESQKGDFVTKMIKARKKLKGSYAFVFIKRGEQKLYAMRKKSPLYVAKTNSGVMIASDIVCFIGLCKEYYCIKEDEIIVADESGFEVFNNKKERVYVSLSKVDGDESDISLGEYKHFMEKEIHEIPEVCRRLDRFYSGESTSPLNDIKSLFEGVTNVFLVGCGTAYHACLYGARILQGSIKIPCHAHIASELKYEDPIVGGSLAIFVSQSGETADTLGCVEIFKEHKVKTIAITNVAHSTIARECDYILPTLAGKEIGVASTKAFVAQILVFYLLCQFLMGKSVGLKGFDKAIEKMICIDDKIVDLVKNKSRAFFIGRGLDSVISLEAALKLKEISYISAEGYPAGELKHGTIALIEKDTPVVVFATQEKIIRKTISGQEEAKSRGAKIILVSPEKSYSEQADFFICLPKCENEWLYCALSIVPFQLLALKVSLALGYDPDKPRNLAKSVTVE